MPNYLTELSPDNNTHVYQIKDKEAAPIDLLKDTVGWVGKNGLQIPASVVDTTYRGITYTIYRNAEGEVIRINAVGTTGNDYSQISLKNTYGDTTPLFPTGTRIKVSTGTSQTFVKFICGVGTTITHDFSVEKEVDGDSISWISLRINANQSNVNVDVYPMIRDASIVDDTYEPYHKSVEDWYWENNPNAGVHNIFDTANKKGGNATTTTITNNGKNIQVTSNTSTYANSTWYLNVEKNTDYVIKADVAITSGLARLKVQTNGGTAIAESSSVTTDGKIELAFNSGDNEQITFVIFVTFATAEVANVMFNNMFIKLASDTVDYYTDYAMTNRELTDAATVKTETVTSNGITYRATRCGKHIQIVAESGALTEAYTGYTKVISLSDFSIFNASEGMYDSYALVTEGSSIKARAYVDSGNNKQIFMNSNVASGSNIRFCFSTYLR